MALRVLRSLGAMPIAWRTRNTRITIVTGMLALHLFSYLAAQS